MCSIGKRLRTIRKLKKISLSELAARSGISKSALSMAERDRCIPASDHLGSICLILGVPSDLIIYGQVVDPDDEWRELSGTVLGQSLRATVLELYRSNRLSHLFADLNYLEPAQLDLMSAQVKALRDQNEGECSIETVQETPDPWASSRFPNDESLHEG